MPPSRTSVETSVRRELKSYPPDIAAGAVARTMILLAQLMDAGIDEPRDLAQVSRELRLASAQLRELAPGNTEGDEVDKFRKRREKRLEETG